MPFKHVAGSVEPQRGLKFFVKASASLYDVGTYKRLMNNGWVGEPARRSRHQMANPTPPTVSEYPHLSGTDAARCKCPARPL